MGQAIVMDVVTATGGMIPAAPLKWICFQGTFLPLPWLILNFWDLHICLSVCAKFGVLPVVCSGAGFQSKFIAHPWLKVYFDCRVIPFNR